MPVNACIVAIENPLPNEDVLVEYQTWFIYRSSFGFLSSIT